MLAHAPTWAASCTMPMQRLRRISRTEASCRTADQRMLSHSRGEDHERIVRSGPRDSSDDILDGELSLLWMRSRGNVTHPRPRCHAHAPASAYMPAERGSECLWRHERRASALFDRCVSRRTLHAVATLNRLASEFRASRDSRNGYPSRIGRGSSRRVVPCREVVESRWPQRAARGMDG